MPRRKGSRSGSRPGPQRSYSRVDRVGRAVAEVVADELEVVNDERLELVTVTGVKVEPGLRHAIVWVSTLVAADNDAALAALDENRVRLQAAIARHLRLRRTPELTFSVDPAIEKGTRVEEILRELHSDQDGDAARDG